MDSFLTAFGCALFGITFSESQITGDSVIRRESLTDPVVKHSTADSRANSSVYTVSISAKQLRELGTALKLRLLHYNNTFKSVCNNNSILYFNALTHQLESAAQDN